jgi:two-component system response regulator protein GraR
VVVSTLTSTILVIEDEYNLRQSLQLILQHAGYTAVTQQNYSGVLDVLGNTQFGLIILSLHNLDPNTISQISNIRTSFPHVPIMVLAPNETADLEGASQMGADVYLVKPVDPTLILAHINDIFRGSSIRNPF